MFPIYMVSLTNFVPVAVFEENLTKKIAIPGSHILKHLGDDALALAGDEDLLGTGAVVCGIERILGHLRNALPMAVVLKKDLVTDRVDEAAQAGRAAQAVGAEDSEHTQKGFLREVFGDLGASYPAAEFDQQQFPEVGGEVLLYAEIVVAKSLDVLAVEGVSLHGSLILAEGGGKIQP